MAIVVEHDKRKHEILEKSLELFCREGYEDVTFQKIADACGITRTTLYIYFKNKREIFNFSIKQLTTELEEHLVKTIEDDSLTSEECLREVMNYIIDRCVDNVQLFVVLFPYLINLQKTGVDTEKRIRRRIIRSQHLLSTIIIRGKNNGEFKNFAVKDINEMLISLIESAIFRIAIMRQGNAGDIKSSIKIVIDGLLNK